MNESPSQEQVIKLDAASKIKIFPLTTQPAGYGKIYMGSTVTESFVKVSDIWQPLSIVSGKEVTIGEISRILVSFKPKFFAKKTQMTDLDLMILTLIQNNLVEEIDGKTIIKQGIYGDGNKGVPGWPKYIVNKFTIPIFVYIALIAIFWPFYKNYLMPYPSDFFWTSSLSLTLLSSFLFGWISGIFHELAHFLTAASQGVKSKFSISHRLTFVVLETRYPNIFAIPKFWRIATYLSGIVLDLILITLMYGIISANRADLITIPLWLLRLLRQFILIEWLTILWEFLFFMKTDIYYVIREAFEVDSLYTLSRERIINIIKRKRFDLKLNKREENVVRAYSLFFILGTIVAYLRYGLYQIPIVFNILLQGINTITIGARDQSISKIADGTIVITIETISLVLLALINIREKRKPLEKILHEKL